MSWGRESRRANRLAGASWAPTHELGEYRPRARNSSLVYISTTSNIIPSLHVEKRYSLTPPILSPCRNNRNDCRSTSANETESRPAAGLRLQFRQDIGELRDRSKQPDGPEPSTKGQLVPEADSILIARQNSSLALLAKDVANGEDEGRFQDSRIEKRDEDSRADEGGPSQASRAEEREDIASLLDPGTEGPKP